MKFLSKIVVLLLVVGIGASSTISRFAFDSSLDVRYSQSAKIGRRIKIENLYFDADDEEPQVLSVKMFSVFNLVSGRMETTVGNQKATHRAEDFWTAKAGSVIKIKVLGEGAILRIIQISE